MKLIIVDLYGDGDCLRVCEDTPHNDSAIREFRDAERLWHKNMEYPKPYTDPPQFSDFVESRGVVLHETRRIIFNP